MMMSQRVLKSINTKRMSTTSTVDAAEPLSPIARVLQAPKMNSYIIAELGCKTNIDVEVFKKGIKQTLLNHPRFSSKLALDAKGKPTGWIQTHVDLDEHLIIPNIDPNIESPDQFVEDYVSSITKTPMNISKPLWEIHILHIKTSKAKSAWIFRIHHSIGDGISLISLLLACTHKSANPDVVPSLPIGKKKKNMTLKSDGYVRFFGRFVRVVLFLKMLWNTLVDLFPFMATTIFLKDTNTPLKGHPGIEKTPKRFVHRVLSLDDIKLIKNAMGMTVNDVVFGITQAALTRYLSRSYGKAKEDNKVQRDNQFNHLRIRSILVVNLRPTPTIEGLAEMMKGESNEQWNWGNAIGYVLVPFNIGVKDDPLDYIRDAKATIDKKKQSLEAPFTHVIFNFVLNTLGLRVVKKLTYNTISNTTLSFSNVIGPREEISFYGHPISYIAPSVYGHPQALTIHFQSYMDIMTVVLAVDPTIIPDPHKLCEDIEESLKLCKDVIKRKLLK